MKLEHIKEIANAVLYEGYLLYPYRQSAIKNRQRWTIGVVYPREYSEANGSIEPWTMQTECLVVGDESTTLTLSLRFLHVLIRSTRRSVIQNEQENVPDPWSIANRFADEPREEGIEREISAPGLTLHELMKQSHALPFGFPAARIEEPADEQSEPIIREQQQLQGTFTIAARSISPTLFKLTVRIENHTPETGAIANRLNAIMQHAFISTHTILQVQQGRFISSIDPPADIHAAIQDCQNLHTWPVLIGDEGETNTMLSSPIILYDYPRIAPESPGALFDGTEIDEILTLRIMTLTEEEKDEMRRGDTRVRQVLERTENLTAEAFMKLHGTIRSMKPVEEEREKGMSNDTSWNFPGGEHSPPESVQIAGRVLRAGDRVVLRPGRHGARQQGTLTDAFDIMLEGKIARIETIQQDFENRLYLVVTLDDDPGQVPWDERVLPGHHFFFFLEEVEPLAREEP